MNFFRKPSGSSRTPFFSFLSGNQSDIACSGTRRPGNREDGRETSSGLCLSILSSIRQKPQQRRTKAHLWEQTGRTLDAAGPCFASVLLLRSVPRSVGLRAQNTSHLSSVCICSEWLHSRAGTEGCSRPPDCLPENCLGDTHGAADCMAAPSIPLLS